MSSLMPRLSVGAFFASTHPNSIENPLFLPTLLMDRFESMLLRVGSSPTLSPCMDLPQPLLRGPFCLNSFELESSHVCWFCYARRDRMASQKKAPEVSKAVGRIQFFDANYICPRVTFLELRAIPYTEVTSQLIAPFILSFLWFCYRPFVVTCNGFNPF